MRVVASLFALCLGACSYHPISLQAINEQLSLHMPAYHPSFVNKASVTEQGNPTLSSAQANKDESSLALNQECVVLVHGLWRSAFALRGIESYLNEAGYQTINISYPSTEFDIPTIAASYLEPAVEKCRQTAQLVHIVTHSMGGIVARSYLQNQRLPKGSRIVMLSPPNQGSELSEAFHRSGWFDVIAGTAAKSLHNGEDGYLNRLGPFPEQLGIIAAYRSWSLWPESLLPTPNDGMVSVSSMMLENMDDIVFVNAGHAMMRFREDVKGQIVAFLQHGSFQHDTP